MLALAQFNVQAEFREMAKHRSTSKTYCGTGLIRKGYAVDAGRVRASGILDRGARGLLLTTADAKLWVIECDLQIEPLIGHNVTVEGMIIGFDRLRADWIGLARAQA
jgi:hypothetical protein